MADREETGSVEFFNSKTIISKDSWHYDAVRLVIGPHNSMPSTICEYVFRAIQGISLITIAAIVVITLFVVSVSIIVSTFAMIGYAIFNMSVSASLPVGGLVVWLIALVYTRTTIKKHVRYYNQGVIWKGKVVNHLALRLVLTRLRFPSFVSAMYNCVVKKVCVPIAYQ